MPYTWKQLKDEALELLFAVTANGRLLSDDPAVRDHLSGMPYSANYALNDLAAIVPIRRSLRIAHFPPENLLGEVRGETVPGGTLRYSADMAGSFFARVSPGATVTLRRENTATLLIPEEGQGLLSVRATFNTPGEIRAEFSSPYQMTVRDVAMYAACCPDDASVPDYGTFTRYDLAELTRGEDGRSLFMCLDPETELTEGMWMNGHRMLCIARDKPGEYELKYHARPQQLDKTTPDDTVIELDERAASIVPYAMAARAVTGDDLTLSAYYMNIYNARKAELAAGEVRDPGSRFHSARGGACEQ